MSKTTAVPQASEFAALVRQARQLNGAEFASAVFAWLGKHVAFDAATLVTTFADRPAYVDAHFHGFSDPVAVLASWGPVSHLDELSPRLLSRPLRAQRQDYDAAEIADERYAPLREHLLRFRILYSACIAVPIDDGRSMTVMILVRQSEGVRYTSGELTCLEALAPHVAETLAVSRGLSLLRSPQLGVGDLPVALVDDTGGFVQTTPAFAMLLWQGRTPQTARLDSTCFDALRRGEIWPLADGLHGLHALAEPPGWLLRVRAVSRLDCLTARERDIARRFADGASHKEIARDLGLAPATVRNHLSNVYAKLDIAHRVGLIAAFGSA